MTDFGRKAGLGDMLKSTYDPNADGVIALPQTEADMKKSVYDTNDDGVVDSVPTHKTSHQDGGTDEMAVTGLVGATPTAIIGSATPGLVYRKSRFKLENGTDADTLKLEFANIWNGDTIAWTDNVAKGATTGHYILNGAGTLLHVKHAGLSDVVMFASASIIYNSTNVNVNAYVLEDNDNIYIRFPKAADGTYQDLTALVDTGVIHLTIKYLTAS